MERTLPGSSRRTSAFPNQGRHQARILLPGGFMCRASRRYVILRQFEETHHFHQVVRCGLHALRCRVRLFDESSIALGDFVHAHDRLVDLPDTGALLATGAGGIGNPLYVVDEVVHGVACCFHQRRSGFDLANRVVDQGLDFLLATTASPRPCSQHAPPSTAVPDTVCTSSFVCSVFSAACSTVPVSSPGDAGVSCRELATRRKPRVPVAGVAPASGRGAQPVWKVGRTGRLNSWRTDSAKKKSPQGAGLKTIFLEEK